MRYFYSVCLLLGGMGLPLLAKTSDQPTTTFSSKAGAKTVCLNPAPQSKVVMERPVMSGPILGDRIVAYPSPTTSFTNPSVSRPDVARELATSRDSDDSDSPAHKSGRLARVTAYWSGEGDYYTGRGMSATGVRLHDGHCAVDPNIIPYGSIVEIPGVGRYVAVDTGSAVIGRTAAREGGHTSAERGAIVVDVYFEDARDGERFESSAAKFTAITWWTPSTADLLARARSLFADENWTKIQSKQL
jgi:3D (Asp-Asp-Asp) domain-containing protein